MYLIIKHLHPFSSIFFFFCLPKKRNKKRALLPAVPTTCGDCAFFDGVRIVFRGIVLYSSRQNRRFPPASGTIPSGRACLAECAHSAWPFRAVADYLFMRCPLFHISHALTILTLSPSHIFSHKEPLPPPHPTRPFIPN